MRILLTADLHYTLRQYDWLLGAAAGFDAMVLAGDHMDVSSAVPAEVQIAALSASLAALAGRTRLLACSGNHDLNARNGAGEKTADWLAPLRSAALAVDGVTVCIGDTLFTLCPWWDGPDARLALERQLESAAAQRTSAQQRWVWAYHAPPDGALSWNGRRHYGDPVLPELVARHAPSAVLCGHIHEAPFRSGGSWIDRIGATWLFNAGRQIGQVPARIEIDFERATARWIWMEGMEERSLAQ